MSEDARWHWGVHLRRIRLDRGYSQTQLATASGIPQSLISQLERDTDGAGGHRNGSIRMAMIFADVFRCPLDELLGRYDDSRPLSPLLEDEREEFDV